MLNLEVAPGVVSLGCQLDVARHVAASVAVELATNVWSDEIEVTLVGFGDDLTTIAPDRMRRVDDLPELQGVRSCTVPAVERREMRSCTVTSHRYTGRAPDGAAVPDCIGSGQSAVQTVLDTLTTGRVTSAT